MDREMMERIAEMERDILNLREETLKTLEAIGALRQEVTKTRQVIGVLREELADARNALSETLGAIQNQVTAEATARVAAGLRDMDKADEIQRTGDEILKAVRSLRSRG